jgi:chemotaxis methyl-accepting protein methylase
VASSAAASSTWLQSQLRRHVTVRGHDLRADLPIGIFDLVLCRNVAFTYFAPECQRAVLAKLAGALRRGGALVLGIHERLPEPAPELQPWPGVRGVFRHDWQRGPYACSDSIAARREHAMKDLTVILERFRR